MLWWRGGSSGLKKIGGVMVKYFWECDGKKFLGVDGNFCGVVAKTFGG